MTSRTPKRQKRKTRTRLDERAIMKWADNLKLTGTEMSRVKKVMGKRTARMRGDV